MKRLKLLSLSILFTLVLASCGDTSSTANNVGDTNNEIQTTEDSVTTVEDSNLDEEEFEDYDFEINMDNEDEIDWDSIHLTKGQFRKFLKDFVTENDSDEEDGLLIKGADLNGSTIHISIETIAETEEIASFTNSFFAVVADSFIRQIYLHSDYSNGKTQPKIIIEDVNLGIVSEQDDFIDFGE